MLDFFRNFLPAYSAHSSSYYTKPISSSSSFSSSFTSGFLTQLVDVDLCVYVLAQLAPFLVLLGLPAFALLARTHWAALVKFVQMGFESLFGGLFWGSGSGGNANANGQREAERSNEKRKRRKEKRDEAGRGRSLSQSSASDRDSEFEEDDADLYYPGLVNISGTYCFLNSVLQATASLAYLQPFLDVIHARAVDLDVPTPVVDTLRDTLQSLNTPKTSRSSLRPVPIINALSTPVPGSQGRSKLFASREHQDAQELFQLLSECIKSEAQAVDAEAQRDRGLGAFTSASSPNSSSSSLFLRNSSSEVVPHYTGGGEAELSSQSVFDGLTANRRSCVVCGYTEAVMHFAFATWSLALPSVGSGVGFGASSSSCTLQECLADYTRLELLTDCVCRRCSMRATHARLKEEVERLTEASSAKPGEAPKSQYRKKKAREARTLERLVRVAIEEGRIEEDLSARGVKMERVVSPASTKQAMIARPPKVLVLHLNRSLHFSPFSSPARNPIRVHFPEILDLTLYTTSGQLSTTPSAPISTPPPSFPVPLSSSSSGPRSGTGIGNQSQRSTTPTQGMYEHPRVLYRLSAVVAHYGAHSFGHYVCFRRKPRFSKDRRRTGTGKGKGEDGRAYPSVPHMPCPYGCECQLCTAYGPVRDFDVGVGPSASVISTAPNSQNQTENQTQNQKRYRPPPPGKGWLRVSDDTVEEVGLERVLSEGGAAFLLFYERVQNGSVLGAAGSSGSSGSALFGRASGVLSPSASPSIESESESGCGSGVEFGLGVGRGVNASMGTGISINGIYSSSQPIRIAGGGGAGSIYQHLKERSTPRSSEETVRPADVLYGTSPGSESGSGSLSSSSTGSSLSLPRPSSSKSKGKGKEEEEETREDAMGSVSVSSSMSSSFGSSDGSFNGIGTVRPRIVRRTTAGRREKSREKGKEKKQRLENHQPDEAPGPGVGATQPSLSANLGSTKQKGREKGKGKDKPKEQGPTEEDEIKESVSPTSASTSLLKVKGKLGEKGSRSLPLPNGGMYSSAQTSGLALGKPRSSLLLRSSS